MGCNPGLATRFSRVLRFENALIDSSAPYSSAAMSLANWPWSAITAAATKRKIKAARCFKRRADFTAPGKLPHQLSSGHDYGPDGSERSEEAATHVTWRRMNRSPRGLLPELFDSPESELPGSFTWLLTMYPVSIVPWIETEFCIE